MQLEEAIGTIESCASLDELMDTLQRVSEDYGFSSFNFLETGATHLDVPFYMGTMKQGFSDDYFGNKLIHVDPCISFARRCNTAFTWSEVPFPQYGGVRKSGAQKTMEVASDHGYTEGLIVPFHFSDAMGRVNSSLIVFFWTDALSRFNFTISRKKHEMHMLMLYWAQRAVEIVGDQFREGNSIVAREMNGSKPGLLTDRERDILSWAGRGKTAGETANILKLSDDTVKTHIRNALIKLGANNKTHGVAKAIYLGLIDV